MLAGNYKYSLLLNSPTAYPTMIIMIIAKISDALISIFLTSSVFNILERILIQIAIFVHLLYASVRH
mgnify:CR=1 FL=1